MYSKDDFIVLDDISKSYRYGDKERIVLDGISVSIERGSINIIMGRSGCGKTKPDKMFYIKGGKLYQ